MDYLVAVVSDRIKAEEAYTALEKAGIPTSQMSILGKGYKTADEFGLIDPGQQAKKRAMLMAIWLVPFGFAGGYMFDLVTGVNSFDWAAEPWNHILGGFAGAIGGAMGSVFVGGGVALSPGSGDPLSAGSGDALPYRNRLNAGKYIVIVQGATSLKNKATSILRPLNPENLQGYSSENY